MVNNFFLILIAVVGVMLLMKFISFLFTRKTVRYGDWAREEKRVNLLNTVRQVREEEGDYARHVRAVPKSKAPVGTVKRRAVQRRRN